MRKELVNIPLKNYVNSRFSKREHLLVVKTILMQINLRIDRSETCDFKVRNFGTIHTHRNKKTPKQRYQKKYNRMAWKAQKEKNDFSTQRLLY